MAERGGSLAWCAKRPRIKCYRLKAVYMAATELNWTQFAGSVCVSPLSGQCCNRHNGLLHCRPIASLLRPSILACLQPVEPMRAECVQYDLYWQMLSSSWDAQLCQNSGPKSGWAAVPFLWEGGELGPHLTPHRLARGLPQRQLASWSIQPSGHNTSTLQTGQTTVRYNRLTNGRPKVNGKV